ncbi:MAG: hypothetical protein WKF30_12660 [Pyrinomonadaceae bacterium]
MTIFKKVTITTLALCLLVLAQSLITTFVTATPAPGSVLFVVGSVTLNRGDTAIKNRLESKGYALIIKAESDSTTADANGKSLVVISSTVTSGQVNTKFRDVAVPVVTYEALIFDDMGMTGPHSGNDFGSTAGQTQSLSLMRRTRSPPD